MKVAIASGKGGTGKTTLATNLAWVAAEEGLTVAYVDGDVEEPNGHLFLRPEIDQQRPIEKLVPKVDPAQCTHCGRCAEVCRYGAIASLANETIVFAELCHACGGCALACPANAISEVARPIGRLRVGRAAVTSDERGHRHGEIAFVDGVLDVGEAMSPPAIHAVKSAAPPVELTLLDAPPGASCPVVEAVRGCDAVILVTEPTPFGLYDLRLAVEMVRAMGLPLAVVVNRADAGDNRVAEYCRRRRLPILAEIPDDRAVAEAYSRGQVIADAVPAFRATIAALLEQLHDGRDRQDAAHQPWSSRFSSGEVSP